MPASYSHISATTPKVTDPPAVDKPPSRRHTTRVAKLECHVSKVMERALAVDDPLGREGTWNLPYVY